MLSREVNKKANNIFFTSTGFGLIKEGKRKLIEKQLSAIREIIKKPANKEKSTQNKN